LALAEIVNIGLVMAEEKKTKSKTRATLPASKAVVSAKISKVRHEHPEWPMKRVVGTAMGILRDENKKK
jgi:hypothetical protein